MTAEVPVGAWDCHMHFYRASDAGRISPVGLLMPPATVSDYERVRKRVSISRFVAVQSVAYGFDNSVMFDALAHYGSEARAIVVVPPDVNARAVEAFEARGARGARAFMLDGAILDWHDLPTIARTIEPFGWHLQIQLDGRTLPTYVDLLDRLVCPIVIEHNGKFLKPVAPSDDAFSALLTLLDNGRSWVKLSGAYETSVDGPPAYEDVSRLARAIVRHRPDRLVWGSNFPHPGFSDPSPDERALLDLLLYWTDGDLTLRDRILVDNPRTLYRAWPAATMAESFHLLCNCQYPHKCRETNRNDNEL